jgi:hypothetical protein
MVMRGKWLTAAQRAGVMRCDAYFAVMLHFGVVKPHGRLGPLRSECLAARPRAAYRRGGLPRPFRGLEAL